MVSHEHISTWSSHAIEASRSSRESTSRPEHTVWPARHLSRPPHSSNLQWILPSRQLWIQIIDAFRLVEHHAIRTHRPTESWHARHSWLQWLSAMDASSAVENATVWSNQVA